ncbi:MAG: HD domain-containing protein [Ignisphaera sp.]|nr:HD domain-containing protein [Ignisphaera sp.]
MADTNVTKRIYDEVHGYIGLTDVELEVINNEVFQRLRFIKQLAAAWYVYPGATHTRFSHSLGAMYLMGLIAQKLFELGYVHSTEDIQLLRLAALLHDVGHTPFSHAIESYYKNALGLDHEELTKIIILGSSIRDVLDYYGYDPKTIVAIIGGHYREPLYNQLLSSEVDVDRMDYLIRDALHTGVTYGIIDTQRLISVIVVDGDGNLSVLDKGLDALENFYLARLHMYRAVYYHKTVVGYEHLLAKIYELLCQYFEDSLLPKSLNDIKKLVSDGDIAMWHDDWLTGYIIQKYRDQTTPELLRELIKAFLFRKGYKVLIDLSKFSDKPLSEDDDDIKLLRSVEVNLKSLLNDSDVSLFVDDIKIVDEDPHTMPRIIVGGKQSIPLTNIENTIISRLPKRYHVKRLYVLSRSFDKARSLIQVP